MATLTIRNLDDALKESLRVQAASNGRSMEEEARLILRRAVGWVTSPLRPVSSPFQKGAKGQCSGGCRHDGEADVSIELSRRKLGLHPPRWTASLSSDDARVLIDKMSGSVLTAFRQIGSRFMGKPAVAIELTEAERAELEGLAGRRRTAQGLARRARLFCWPVRGLRTLIFQRDWLQTRTPSAGGGGALPSAALTGSKTNRAPGRRARSLMRPSPRRSG